MIELYLNNTRVQLQPDTAFSLTKQVNDFAELKDRQGTYTNSFNIPKTKYNIEIFNGLGIVGNKSAAPRQKLSARIVVNSVSVISDGFAIVKETAETYKVTVYDGNIYIAEVLGNKTLSELDLASLNHDLTTGNFSGSFSHDYADGYIYGIADFGNFDPAGIVINNQLPSFFVRWIWDKIFSGAGFTVDFEPENNLVITGKRGYDTNEDSGNAIDIEGTAENYFYIDVENYGVVSETQRIVIQPNQELGGVRLEDGYYTILQNGIYYINLDVQISNENNLYDWRILTFVNGVLISYDLFTQLNLNVGDTVEIYIEASFFADTYNYSSANFLITNNFYTVSGGSGLQITLSSFIGEMKQIDFVKDVMQHYGLISQKVKDEQSLKFIQAKTMLRDVVNAKDYSGKVLQLSETYDNDYAKSNLFKYQYKNSDSEPFADGNITIDNEILIPEKTQVTRPYYAPEKSETLLNNNVLLSVPFWVAERDDTGAITKWKVEKSKNYFAKVVMKQGTVYHKTANGTLQTFTGNYPILNFDNLNYQSILDANYGEVQNMINYFRNIKAQIRMNLFEFDSFDFFKLIYSSELGGYFYINSLKWTNGKPLVDAQLQFVPQDAINTTVARIGVYPNQRIGFGDIALQLDGSESVNYETANWKFDSVPASAVNYSFSGDKEIDPILNIQDNINNIGDWVISLTLNGSITAKTLIKVTS